MARRSKPIVISYLRFSRLEQKAGDSIRRQLDASRKWAESHSLTIEESFRDEGVSAFRGKNATQGALGRILRAIEAGRIPSGSTLLVESLDRLSRTEVFDALHLFMSILRAGVKVVTLGDGAREFTRESVNQNPFDLMLSITIMARAREESAMKSMRGRKAWEQKRNDAIGNGKVMTRMLPSWLREERGKLVPIAAKVRTIKKVFDLVSKGYGIGALTRKFNRAGEPNIGRGNRWHSTYIHSILRNRAVLGEFVLHTSENGFRVPVKTITCYYPAIIDENVFDTANAVLSSRRSRKYGGPSARFTNIFSGLLYDEMDEPYTTFEKNGKRYLVSLGALLGKKDHQVNLRQSVFEALLFEALSMRFKHPLINKSEGSGPLDDAADAVRAKVIEITSKIESIQRQVLGAGPPVPSVVVLLEQLERQKQDETAKLTKLQQQLTMANPSRITLFIARFNSLASGQMSEDDRGELQATMRLLVKKISLRLVRSKNLITGFGTVIPMVGEQFRFRLEYHPYTNDANEDPLRRAQWEYLG